MYTLNHTSCQAEHVNILRNCRWPRMFLEMLHLLRWPAILKNIEGQLLVQPVRRMSFGAQSENLSYIKPWGPFEVK